MAKMLKVLFALGMAGVASQGVAAGGPYAVFKTAEGEFVCELYPAKAPKTVENFVGLATGKKAWTHPGSQKKMEGAPYYNGTVFHRTMPGFMIQGGDPLGTGTGGPGYAFEYEGNDLDFSKPGVLAMANRGARTPTNGSQFFVTVAPTPSLNNGYTIFGQCVSGMDVVNKIVNKPSAPGSGKALEPVKLISVEIVDSLPGKDGGEKKSDAKPAAKPADDKTTSGK